MGVCPVKRQGMRAKANDERLFFTDEIKQHGHDDETIAGCAPLDEDELLCC